LPPMIFPSSTSVKLIGEFTSLEEPSDDSDITIVLDSLANRPGFAGSERRIEPSCRWILCRKNTGYHATDPKI
jgi:hypothetical protein